MTSPAISVFVCGPSSSGKTTLCNALAKHLALDSNLYIRETARKVMQTQGFSRKDVHTYEMKFAILTAQVAAEDMAIQHVSQMDRIDGQPIILSDRSGMDAVVYADLDPDGAEQKRQLTRLEPFNRAVERYRDSLFIVLEPVQEWIVDDGVRSLYGVEEYHSHFIQFLQQWQVPFKQLGPEVLSLDERVSHVIAWIDEHQQRRGIIH
ncbi:AAA domain-containing protein, partial [Auriculariales sp. MPI-PUGE-AT-0066]